MNIWQEFFIPTFFVIMIRIKRVFHLFWLSYILLVVIFVFYITFGSTDINIIKAVKDCAVSFYESPDLRILVYVRLPRGIAAVFAGSALAVSGVLVQAVLNNPMAAPNIIGVNSGAGLAVIVTNVLLPQYVSLIPFAAFAGAMAACVVIYAIASKNGIAKITVTLAGIAVTGILNACINAVKTVFPNSIYNYTVFSVGGLGGVDAKILLLVCPIILVCILIAILLSRNIDILCLGEATAASLGMNVGRFGFIVLMLAAALAGCAVSFAGLLGFIGLIIPHIARRFVGNRHKWLLPLSAVWGAIFVLLCDLFCRIMFRPYEVPVGIIISFIGGIFFIFIILWKGTARD